MQILQNSSYFCLRKINDLSYNATGVRYGYNGTHEQDKEVNADGNYLDFDENGNLLDTPGFISNEGEFGYIFLDLMLIQAFEKPLRFIYLFEEVKETVEATVLHEDTHIGDGLDNSFQYNSNGKPVETGDEFEKDAYGKDIILPRPLPREFLPKPSLKP